MSKKHKDPRKVWESEEGFPKKSSAMSQFKTNGASMNKSVNDNGKWLSEKKKWLWY